MVLSISTGKTVISARKWSNNIRFGTGAGAQEL